MESNTVPLTKEQLGEIINQQLYTINCLVNDRMWLTEQLSMYHDTTIQWQQYAQSLETDLQRRQKEQAKIEEAHSQLDIKYQDLKWIYWQVNRKYEKCKAEFKYGMEVGESVCAEYLYYKHSYTELLEHYRKLWSACYATRSGSDQEQERSEVTEPVQGTHKMFVSDEADRNNGERAAEPASECHNTADDDVELDSLSQLNGDEPPVNMEHELNCADLSAKPKVS